ncbi:MAG: helix-turn-helix transcriptional regulator [Cryomorphaceae bacterium]|nr:helix-turn-helix transcriptional regulator [Cryomorphaceae bacterium]
MINTAKIRTIREKKGFSQEYMASKLNISQPVYARMESGQKKIEAGLLFKIAEELEEKIESFIDEASGPYQSNYNNENSTFNCALNQTFHYNQKEIVENIKNIYEEIAEMRKERQELIALLKGKM